jgi:microcin C transport system permease protein
MKNERQPEGYWRIVARQFRKNRLATGAFAVIIGVFAIAAAADFIANDKPLVMRYRGEIYFPVLKDYTVRLGLSQWDKSFQNVVFKEFTSANFSKDDWAHFPLIPYGPNEVNLGNVLERPSGQHFFGTDDIGRDVASRICMARASRFSSDWRQFRFTC